MLFCAGYSSKSGSSQRTDSEGKRFFKVMFLIVALEERRGECSFRALSAVRFHDPFDLPHLEISSEPFANKSLLHAE